MQAKTTIDFIKYCSPVFKPTPLCYLMYIFTICWRLKLKARFCPLLPLWKCAIRTQCKFNADSELIIKDTWYVKSKTKVWANLYISLELKNLCWAHLLYANDNKPATCSLWQIRLRACVTWQIYWGYANLLCKKICKCF